MSPQTSNKTSVSSKARNWCFTLFNYDDNTLTHLKGLNTEAKHIAFQIETCPTTGKKHIQGHICFVNPRTMNGVKKVLGDKSVHLEVMRGTVEQSLNYVTKDDTHMDGDERFVAGEITGQGDRTDLKELHARIVAGELSMNDIMMEYPQLYCQYKNGLRDIHDAVHGKPRESKTHVSVYYGRSGTGKSKKAFEENDDVYVLRPNKNTVWFDGYTYNKTVVIDDFYGWIPFNMMLNLLDRYAMKVDIKGGAMEFNSPKIIITSNKSPLDWYPNLSTEHKYALLRRLDEVLYFKRDSVVDVMEGIKMKMAEYCDDDESDNDELLVITEASSKTEHGTEVPQGNTILSACSKKEVFQNTQVPADEAEWIYDSSDDELYDASNDTETENTYDEMTTICKIAEMSVGSDDEMPECPKCRVPYTSIVRDKSGVVWYNNGVAVWRYPYSLYKNVPVYMPEYSVKDLLVGDNWDLDV